jgi:hypothetical protein
MGFCQDHIKIQYAAFRGITYLQGENNCNDQVLTKGLCSKTGTERHGT